MISNKVRSVVDLRNLDENPTTTYNTMDLVPTILVSSILMSYRNGRVVIQLDWFMYLGESLEAILEEHEIDLTYYDETISNVDAHV